jgi:hypothetical protein
MTTTQLLRFFRQATYGIFPPACAAAWVKAAEQFKYSLLFTSWKNASKILFPPRPGTGHTSPFVKGSALEPLEGVRI